MTIILVNEAGELVFIYKDAMRPLIEEGEATIRRASHVEPTPDGKWTADLTPVSGPILGSFALRDEALREEIRWLEEHHLM